MSQFFVGQRVRIVRCKNPEMQLMVGQEGVIEGKSTVHLGSWFVSGARIDRSGRRCSWSEYALEPILPEGSAPSEFTFQQLMDNLQEVMA